MNAQDIYSRQLGIGELLTLSWTMIKNNYQSLLLFAVIIFFPVNLIFSLLPQNLSLINTINSFVSILTQILSTLAVAVFIKAKLDNKSLSLKEAMNSALSNFGRGITTNLLSFIVLILLFIALIIPGIIFGIYWIFAGYALALHGKSNMEALRYSKTIVQNRWWRTFGYSAVFFILFVIGMFILTLPFIPLPEHPLIDFVSQSLHSILSVGLIVIYTLFYINFDSTKIPDAPKQVEQVAA